MSEFHFGSGKILRVKKALLGLQKIFSLKRYVNRIHLFTGAANTVNYMA